MNEVKILILPVPSHAATHPRKCGNLLLPSPETSCRKQNDMAEEKQQPQKEQPERKKCLFSIAFGKSEKQISTLRVENDGIALAHKCKTPFPLVRRVDGRGQRMLKTH